MNVYFFLGGLPPYDELQRQNEQQNTPHIK